MILTIVVELMLLVEVVKVMIIHIKHVFLH